MQVVKEMADRLLDFDDKVRAAAATALCTTAISTPRVSSIHLSILSYFESLNCKYTSHCTLARIGSYLEVELDFERCLSPDTA